MARSLIARNPYGVPNHRRGATSKEKVLAASRSRWALVGDVYAKRYGREQGSKLTEALVRSEHDFVFGCTFLFGVRPLQWQADMWNDGLCKYRLNVARMMNGGGKTTGMGLFELYAGFMHSWAARTWGQYRMLHFAPQESNSLETHIKITEILENRAREQKWIDHEADCPERKQGNHAECECPVKTRKAFARRWIKPTKIGKHEAFSFFDGRATLEFVTTAYRGKGKDGTDPMFITFDEARHEQYLTHLVDRIFLPRFLRTPGSRLYIPYTPLEASPELEELLDRGLDPTNRRWYGVVVKDIREANPTLRDEDIDLVTAELGRNVREQVLSGEATQPAGAKFTLGAVKAMFEGSSEPDWLSDMTGLRKRVEGRCEKCLKRTEGHPEEHLMASSLDPASSAEGGDDIVFMAADLDPPCGHALRIEYIESIERTGAAKGPETLPNVAKHLQRLALEIASPAGIGPTGYDRKSAIGHGVKDHMAEFDGDIVEVAHDTSGEKDEAVDLVQWLIEHGEVCSPYCRKLRVQLSNYVRHNDRKLIQDHVMTLVYLCQVAQPYLPVDLVEAFETRDRAAVTVEEARQQEAGETYGAIPTPTDIGVSYGVDPMALTMIALEDADRPEASVAVARAPVRYAPQRRSDRGH